MSIQGGALGTLSSSSSRRGVGTRVANNRSFADRGRLCRVVVVIWRGGDCITLRCPFALYADALATIWTTAASPPQRRPSAPQLAAVCLVLATIAARCYASQHHSSIVNVRRPPPPFSPINDSTTGRASAPPQVPHSSNLVLSRLLRSATTIRRHHHHHQHHHHLRKSDTSIIVRNSKKLLLHNQNSKRYRTKRAIIKLNYTSTERSLSSAVVVASINSSDGVLVAASEKRVANFTVSNFGESKTQLGRERSSGESLRHMPPVHDHGNASSVGDLGVLVLILSAIVLTVALGLITCVLSHYRPVAGAAPGAGPHHAAHTPTTAPMLSVVSAGAAAGVGGMDRLRGGRAARELAATRDRQVRLHAVHADIAINLPPSIAMPDGEEHPFTSSRLHVRDPEQESELHQKCIRPPPNRTVLESESPPPYRSSSTGLLGSSSSSSCSSSCGGGGGDWSSSGGGNAPLVVRCHSMSSSSNASSKRPDAGSSGQKTDFLQRTVNKIFTGGSKKGGGMLPPPPPPHLAPHHQQLPVVIVPTTRHPPRRTPADNAPTQKLAAAAHNKPSV